MKSQSYCASRFFAPRSWSTLAQIALVFFAAATNVPHLSCPDGRHEIIFPTSFETGFPLPLHSWTGGCPLSLWQFCFQIFGRFLCPRLCCLLTLLFACVDEAPWTSSWSPASAQSSLALFVAHRFRSTSVLVFANAWGAHGNNPMVTIEVHFAGCGLQLVVGL